MSMYVLSAGHDLTQEITFTWHHNQNYYWIQGWIQNAGQHVLFQSSYHYRVFRTSDWFRILFVFRDLTQSFTESLRFIQRNLTSMYKVFIRCHRIILRLASEKQCSDKEMKVKCLYKSNEGYPKTDRITNKRHDVIVKNNNF